MTPFDFSGLDLSQVRVPGSNAPALSELRAALSPRELAILAEDAAPDWTLLALDKLLRTLTKHGSIVDQAHREALLTLLSAFTCRATGIRSGRTAIPLPTGMGKTQAIVAWCAAMHEGGFLGQVSLAVSAAKVEALAKLKRDLIGAGIPESQIGLMHSYKFMPQASQESVLPEGHASEPSDADARDRPILLAAHNRIKKGIEREFNSYLSHPRNLLIWDESLVTTEAWAFTVSDLGDMTRLLGKYLRDGGPTMDLLSRAKAMLTEERERLSAGLAPTTLKLEGDFESARAELLALKSTFRKPWTRDAANELAEFIDLADQPFVLQDTQQGSGLISFVRTIPASIKSAVILDASYPIRTLCHFDKSITPGLDLQQDLKRFDRVKIAVTKAPSGRHSVENPDNLPRYAAYVIDALSSIPADQSVIVFTFRKTGSSALDCVAELKQALSAAGFDPEQLNAESKPRVVFLTWGQETSLSEFSYCQNVIFAGVVHRSHLDLAASACGQLDNLMANPPHEVIKELEASEIAHALYQALSRGSSRIIESGQARAMRVWLPIRYDRVIELLAQAMPGVQLITVESPHLSKKTKPEQLKQHVANFLGRVDPSTTAISSRKLKDAIPELELVSSPIAARAIQLGADAAGWEKVDRSIRRQQSVNEKVP